MNPVLGFKFACVKDKKDKNLVENLSIILRSFPFHDFGTSAELSWFISYHTLSTASFFVHIVFLSLVHLVSSVKYRLQLMLIWHQMRVVKRSLR